MGFIWISFCICESLESVCFLCVDLLSEAFFISRGCYFLFLASCYFCEIRFLVTEEGVWIGAKILAN